MAWVAGGSRYTRENADGYLSYLEAEWRSLPELAEEWGEYDVLDKIDFDHEWGIREDRLRHLQRWADQGLLTRDQRTRYEALLKLVEGNRPLLERLLEEEEPAEARRAA